MNDLNEAGRASKFAKYCPECRTAHCVKCFDEINEEQVEALVAALFLELPDGKDHVNRTSLFSEAPLVL